MTIGLMCSTSPATTATEAAGAAEPATLILLSEQRIARAGCRRARRGHTSDAGHDLGALLQVAVHQFGERAVGDPQAQVHRLELSVDEQPHPALRLRRRQGLEQFLNLLAGLRLAVARLKHESFFRRRAFLRGSFCALLTAADQLFERRRVGAATLHARDELLLLVR